MTGPSRPPGLFETWRLGHPGASLLGTTTTLSGDDTGRDVATGQSVFPWVADTWPVGLTIHAALRDVCAASEGGTFSPCRRWHTRLRG